MRKDQKLHEKETMEDHLLLTKPKLNCANQVNAEAIVKLEVQLVAKLKLVSWRQNYNKRHNLLMIWFLIMFLGKRT